jgi:hypothetical protein
LYKRAWDEQVAPRYRAGEPAPGMSRERFLRLLDAAESLAAHIHEAPVWIVPCLEGGTPTRTSGSSIYPAVQNMLLAARALGLGGDTDNTVLTVREGGGGRARVAARRPLVCLAADRLSHGPVRASPPNCARRCGLRRPVGTGLPRSVADFFFSLRVGQPRSRLSEHHEARGVAMGMRRRVIPRKVSPQVGTDSILTLHPA